MFKYFKGEKENPFDAVKENAQHIFWTYELSFENEFNKGDFSIDSWAIPYAEDIKEWRSALSKNPINKADIFKLWLFNLLMKHLPEKHVSDKDKFLNLYYDSEA